MIKRTIRSLANRFGYEIVRCAERWRGMPVDLSLARELDSCERAILKLIEPFTLTSVERVIALVRAVRYLAKHRIPGALVECGVWQGGSMMAAACALREEGDLDRDLYLFDTFEGMPQPTGKDRDVNGTAASNLLADTPEKTGPWCYATLEAVRNNMRLAGYPEERVHFIQGRVEETIPRPGLSEIALLRLDTDWYESTYHELKHLYPLLAVGGVLILDDYGHWQGAREAADQYFAEHKNSPILLHRLDYTGRIAVKTATS